MKFGKTFTALLAVAFISCTAFAQGTATRFEFVPAKGSSDFLATGRPGSFKIKGKGGGPAGQLVVQGNHVKGAMTLDLNSFDTGMKMRNEHMKTKYLQTDKFPTARLDIDSAAMLSGPLVDGGKIDHGVFDGKLTLHGITRETHGTFTADYASGTLNVDANFDVGISEFGITKPSFSGVSVDDKIVVHLSASAKAER